MFEKFLHRKIAKVLVICFVFGWLVFWNPQNIFSGVRNVWFYTTYPIGKFFISSADKISSFSEVVNSVGNLKKENGELLKNNIKLQAKNAELENIKKENEELRKQIEVLPRDKFNLTTAKIIGQSSYGTDSWLLINKGTKSGLRKNMPVIAFDSVLIGVLGEVFSESAKVILVTSAESAINGVSVETGAKGIVQGDYGLSLIFAMVLQSDLLKTGDQVITSKINSTIPEGLLIGEIKDIHPSADNLFQQANVIAPINFSDLRFVSVIL
jgi:rod shape-determining protein MreC